jgi:hypothetical protein
MQREQQDELAGMFNRTMNISNPTPPPDTQFQPPPPAYELTATTGHVLPKLYASTHYTHTHHVVPVRFIPHSPSPEPRPALSDPQIFTMLLQNGIDPTTLFAPQIHLIRHADPEQRLRLLELWRISPPNLGAYDLAKEQQSWHETTLAKEEEMARLRFERQTAERNIPRVTSSSDLISEPSNLADVMQQPERPSSAPELLKGTAEPYILNGYASMTSGYEQLLQREYEESQQTHVPLRESTRYNQATDPAFRGPELWQKPSGQDENSHFVMEDQEMGM